VRLLQTYPHTVHHLLADSFFIKKNDYLTLILNLSLFIMRRFLQERHYTPWSIKTCHFYFLNSFILADFNTFGHARDITKELDASDCSYSLGIYNNEFILDSARIGSKMIN